MRPTVPQALRDRSVKSGLVAVFEPPRHVRPKKGPCPYVDTKNPKTGELGQSRFTFEGKDYEVDYISGCFYPFIFACG